MTADLRSAGKEWQNLVNLESLNLYPIPQKPCTAVFWQLVRITQEKYHQGRYTFLKGKEPQVLCLCRNWNCGSNLALTALSALSEYLKSWPLPWILFSLLESLSLQVTLLIFLLLTCQQLAHLYKLNQPPARSYLGHPTFIHCTPQWSPGKIWRPCVANWLPLLGLFQELILKINIS